MTCYTWEVSEASVSIRTPHMIRANKSPHQPHQRKMFFRLVLASLVLALVLSFSLILKANAGASDDPHVRTEGHAVIDVGAGESLWTIAREHAEGRSMKSYIRDLKQLNDLESNTLQIGQILYLP